MSKQLSKLLANVSNLGQDGRDLITKAYQFAEKYHAGQTRYSGEPYLNHLFETALILAELGMSPTVVAAGLLHDADEDTEATPEDIEKEFGKEIRFLVEGVTKLGHIRFKGMLRHAESLRKLFVATSEDVRVMIIKLADRLHNIKTLNFVPEEKQLRIATETLEIYAPIAYRLGIRTISKQLEDYAFPYVYPEDYERVQELLTEQREQTDKELESFHKTLKKKLAEAGFKTARTSFRTKGIYSLYQKLERKNWDIDRVYDLSAIRVIVDSVGECYQILGVVHGTWRPIPGRVKDYIAFPKPNGYQSIHTDILTGHGGHSVEIQIRTEAMHREAEYGIASHLAYKEAGKDSKKTGRVLSTLFFIQQLLPGGFKKESKNDAEDVPTWIRDLASYQEELYGDDFMQELKTDFLSQRMFVFTPKGDVIDLPMESTVLDFAYAVHSDLGQHMSGSKVNGKMKSIDTMLHNGDVVEVLTNKNNKPSRKWLDVAKTGTAKKHIRAFLKAQEEAA